MLPKKDRLTRRSDFRRIYNEGKRFHIDPLTVFAIHSTDLKVGVVVPKVVGIAVVRNRIRRRISEAVRQNRSEFNNYHIIFKVDEDSLPTDYNDLQDLLKRIARRIDV